MSWTEERIDRLKSMWAKGSTASQIADELGGVSRNAVIGKAHRLGLESRPSPVKPGEEKDPKSVKPAAKKAAAKAPVQQRSEVPSDSPDHADDIAPGDAPSGAGPRFAQQAPVMPHRASQPQPDPNVQYRSVGPGGFIRQGPGDTQAPIPPAPPR